MSDLLPIDRLLPFLEAEMGIKGTITAEKTTTGQSNPTFVISAGRNKMVLRRKPPGKLLKSAHAVDREFRVMQALSGHAVVPKMYVYCDDESIIGSAFYIMEFIDGDTFDDPAMPEKSSDVRAKVYDQMNAALAGLHKLDPETLGLADYGKPGNYFQRQLSRWSAQYDATATETISAVDRLIRWLGDYMPPDDGKVALVHGDWRIDNLLFDRKNNALKAILDWELSTIGHPFADLGAQLMQWAMPPGELGRGLSGVNRAELGLPTDEEYVRLYADRAGLAQPPEMTFYVVFAFFRMAAILQGVKKRAMDGNASNAEKGLMLGRYVPVLAEKAWERISAAR